MFNDPSKGGMMAVMAIEKPLTPRGNLWFHRHNPHRSRGDRCHHREKRSEGPRIVALAQASLSDLEQQFEEIGQDEMLFSYELVPPVERKFWKRWRKSRARDGRREQAIDEFAAALEAELEQFAPSRDDIEARCRFLRDLLEFYDQHGSSDPVLQQKLKEQHLELVELEAQLTLLPAA